MAQVAVNEFHWIMGAVKAFSSKQYMYMLLYYFYTTVYYIIKYG